MTKIEGLSYNSVDECMAAFFQCRVSELKEVTESFEMLWAGGKEEGWDVQKAISDIRKRACWAWIEGKMVIHYYISKDATMTQVVKLFGHEIGHMQRPFHRSLKEEQKADKYSNVAAAAYQIAIQAMDSIKINN